MQKNRFASEGQIVTALELLTHAFSDSDEFVYGVELDTDFFQMRPYCRCYRDDCDLCSRGAPNFIWKTDPEFHAWWYKYLGRGMRFNRELEMGELMQMLHKAIDEAMDEIE